MAYRGPRVRPVAAERGPESVAVRRRRVAIVRVRFSLKILACRISHLQAMTWSRGDDVEGRGVRIRARAGLSGPQEAEEGPEHERGPDRELRGLPGCL